MIRLLAVLFLLSAPAAAREVSCTEALTQHEMNQCQYEVWQEADARLNDAYADVIAMLRQSDVEYPLEGASEEDRMRKAQRAWVAFRDANCDAAGYPMRGGSAEPLLVFGCMHQMTEDRIEALFQIIEGS